MKDYNKSFYALNKKSKGIVYQNADGSILEVTFEKISNENPNFTKEDFEKLKELSDGLYHQEAKNDYKYHYHINGTYDNIENSVWLATECLEDEMERTETDKCYTEKLQEAIDTLLTPVQKKRLYMNCFRDMSTREIAKIEGTNQKSVSESIRAAKRKIKQFLINF